MSLTTPQRINTNILRVIPSFASVTLQILTHTKEKLQFVVAENAVTSRQVYNLFGGMPCMHDWMPGDAFYTSTGQFILAVDDNTAKYV